MAEIPVPPRDEHPDGMGGGGACPELRCPKGRNCHFTRMGYQGQIVACEDASWPPCKQFIEFGGFRICRVLSERG